jgi:xanthine dehydrogenase accessory factor
MRLNYFASLSAVIAAGRRAVAFTVVSAGPLIGKHLLTEKHAVLLSELDDPGLDAALLLLVGDILHEGKARTVEAGGLRLYAEPYLPPPVLVVVGAGHVAQPVAQIGKLMGFAVTVIDDRPEWANRERFPTADRVICDEFLSALQTIDAGPQHHFVLVTRGHRYDMDCLRALIALPIAYIGMIGSRTRVEIVFRLLQEEHGVDPAHFAKVYAPIGLDLNARTPAEIGVAVAAELLKVRHGGSGEHLSLLGRSRVHGR